MIEARAQAEKQIRREIGLNKIKRILPHRYPMLMLDKVIQIGAEPRGIGIKNVTINEIFFQGHFPDHPIMPGVLIIESMAQTAVVLWAASLGSAAGDLPYFTTIDKARFRHPVEPGDVLELHVSLSRRFGEKIWKFSGEAQVGGRVVAGADISAARITGANGAEKK